jgi:hypothetical protein
LDIRPIKRTLPHVKKIVECNPITMSVAINAKITKGINEVPNITGT